MSTLFLDSSTKAGGLGGIGFDRIFDDVESGRILIVAWLRKGSVVVACEPRKMTWELFLAPSM